MYYYRHDIMHGALFGLITELTMVNSQVGYTITTIAISEMLFWCGMATLYPEYCTKAA